MTPVNPKQNRLQTKTLYSQKVLDHYRAPRHAGALDSANAVGRAENPACGDSMRLYARIENGVIAEISCQTYGCAPSVAAGSILTEMVEGKDLHTLRVDAASVEEALGGLPPIKKHAAVLAVDAFEELLREYNSTPIERT